MKELQEIGGVQEPKTEPLLGEQPTVDAESMAVVKPLMEFRQSLRHLSREYLTSTYLSLTKETLALAVSVVGQVIISCSTYAFLNTKHKPLLQACFGILTSYWLVFFIAINQSNMDKLGISFSVAFGEKDYAKCKKVFTQGVISIGILFCLITLPMMMFAEEVLLGISIARENAEIIQKCLKAMSISMFIQLISELLKTFCMAQGIEKIFGRVAIVNVIAAIFFNYYLIVVADYEVMGYIITRTVYEAINLLTSLYALRDAVPETLGFVSFTEAMDGFGAFFIDTIRYTFASYSEFIAYEITTYLVALTHDNDIIGAYTTTLSMAGITYTLGLSFCFICRTRINILIGMGEKMIAKNFYRFYMVCVLITALVLSALGFFFRYPIAEVYASATPKMKEYFIIFSILYCIDLPSELTINTTFVGIKTVSKIGYQLKLNFLFLCVCHPVLAILMKLLNFPTPSLFACQIFFVTLNNYLCYREVMNSDWNKATNMEEGVSGALPGDKVESVLVVALSHKQIDLKSQPSSVRKIVEHLEEEKIGRGSILRQM